MKSSECQVPLRNCKAPH